MVLCSCNDDKLATYKLNVVVELPSEYSNLEIVDASYTFKDLSSGEQWSCESLDSREILAGFYDLTYEANVLLPNGNKIAVSAIKQNLVVDKNLSLILSSFEKNASDDFVIQEIFFAGSQYENGRSYSGDQYIVVFNNSDKVLYADGLAILESRLLSTQKYDIVPNYISDYFMTQCVYVVPGNGYEHPVEPGKSITICDVGIDHRQINPNSIDLSSADFEWYDVSSSAAVQDIDSESVPNLYKWYCYTNTIWLLHNRGFKAYAIARMQCDQSTFLSDYEREYSYVNVTSAGAFDMMGRCYVVPNSWIIDAVQCGVESEHPWNVIDNQLDRGFTHCGSTQNDATRYFKSVRRKLLRIESDGRPVLKDSNDSSSDFNNECVPSVFERQNASISAEGEKALLITWDGVTPVQ